MNEKDKQSSQQQLNIAIYNLCMQSMRSSQTLFPIANYEHLLARFQLISKDNPAVLFLEEFVLALLEQAGKMKHQLFLNFNKLNYSALEHSLQKCQAEIRSHIKVQQQLKIYLDNLQQKVEQLQGQLQLQNHKYQLLLKSLKELEQAHTKMQGHYSQPSEPIKQVSPKPVQNGRRAKLGLKSRMLMEKLQERAKRANQLKKNQIKSKNEEQGPVASQQQMSIVSIKKPSLNRYNKQAQSHSSIKGLTKSLHLKHDKSVQCYLKRHKKRTESHNRQGCSSIMY